MTMDELKKESEELKKHRRPREEIFEENTRLLLKAMSEQSVKIHTPTSLNWERNKWN